MPEANFTANAEKDKESLGQALRKHLAEASRLRAERLADPGAEDHLRLKAWQSARLAATYADLLADPRYSPASRFFLEELYGTRDFTSRDAEVARIVPTLVAMLPARALHTLVEAVRMDALSESLDSDMVAALRRMGRERDIDGDAYARAYCLCGRSAERLEQIALVDGIGNTLDRLTRMPLLSTTLRLMKAPAAMAGLTNLHAFLQHGFEAFRHMKGAPHFLATIRDRETRLMKQLLVTRQNPL